MDPHRVNEFGTSADDHQSPAVGVADQQQSVEGVADQQQQSVEGGASEEATSQSSDSELSLDDSNNELRRRLHKSED